MLATSDTSIRPAADVDITRRKLCETDASTAMLVSQIV